MSKCKFNITDIKNMMSIIEVCTKRGAFNAEELSGVGLLFNKLKSCETNCDEKVEDLTTELETKCDVNCEMTCDDVGKCGL